MLPLFLGGIAAIIFLFMAYRSLRRKMVIDDTPTSKTKSVFIGPAELKGLAECEFPLEAIFSRIKCVYFSWRVEEQKEIHTKSGTTRQWQTIAGGENAVPFYLKDDTGVIRIIPAGAKITGKETFYRTCSGSEPFFVDSVPLPDSGNDLRYSETCIPLHTPLYVLGHARERKDVVAVEVAKNSSGPAFIISTSTEKQISTAYGILYYLWLILGLAAVLTGVAWWNVSTQPNAPVNWAPFLEGIIIYLLAMAAGWTWMTYNSLVGLYQQTGLAWSQVDIEVKRRHDLIPNLVKAVQGYADHERTGQELMTELRNQMEATAPGRPGPDYKGLRDLIKATAEKYPELKANSSFLELQRSLADTEQRVALARDYYNNITTFYNTRLEVIPDRFVAWLAGFYPRLLFKAMNFERAVIKVSLVK